MVQGNAGSKFRLHARRRALVRRVEERAEPFTSPGAQQARNGGPKQTVWANRATSWWHVHVKENAVEIVAFKLWLVRTAARNLR
jgi:hypothetical protein